MAIAIEHRIVDKASYRRFLLEDMQAFEPKWSRWRPWYGIKYPTLAWLRKLRLAEYMMNTAQGRLGKAIGLLFRLRARSAGKRLGFTIPPNVFGPGLRLPHWGTIIVNDKAVVGARCTLHPCTVLGVYEGGVPTLGNDCYIGAGAKLYGAIMIGDRVRIAPNAAVGASFPADQVIGGVPARTIRPAS